MLASRGVTRLQWDGERVIEKVGGLYKDHPQGESRDWICHREIPLYYSKLSWFQFSSVWVEMYVNVNVICVQTEHSQTDTSTTIWLPSHLLLVLLCQGLM